MMNNPMASMLMQAMQGGGNPLQFIQQMAGQNPQAAQVLQMVNGKSPAQLQQIATNMASQFGTTPQEIVARFMGR